MKPSGRDDEKLGVMLQSFSPYLTLGAQLAVSVVVFFFIGKYLDEHFNTAPWLMIVFVLLGIAGGMIKFFRTVMELSKKQDEQK
ncbi:MAG: AtpZ/AtpI family protein [Bacteroidetes bacterium]|nr:AtpZ/AtpI family protein [Bacteroidota bacterium]